MKKPTIEQNTKKLKILISAYACSPDKGSEEAVGWNWIKEISKKNDIWVLIKKNEMQNRRKFHKYVSELPHKKNIRLIFISLPLFKRKTIGIIYSLMKYFPNINYITERVDYYFWQVEALKVSKRVIRKSKIDLVHHVTYASWVRCGYLWKLGLPFILGPVSGSQYIPLKAYPFLRIRDKIVESLKIPLNKMHYFLNSRSALQKASLVLPATYETLNDIRKVRGRKPTILFTEVGINSVAKKSKKKRIGDPINLLWVGKLVPRKNFGLILEAVKRLPSDMDWNLRVAGSGFLASYWRKKVKKAGLERKIKFLGQVSYAKIKELYLSSDIFVFSSLREGTPNVILEALSCGLPVISLELNGPKVVINEENGILIKVANKEKMIYDFSNAIKKLANDPQLRKSMGLKGIETCQKHYLWSKKGELMNKYYYEVLNEKH